MCTRPWVPSPAWQNKQTNKQTKTFNKLLSLALWYTPVIPALGRLRQKEHKFKAS
jgi:hypothetical protein